MSAWNNAMAGLQTATDHVNRIDPEYLETALQALFAVATRQELLNVDHLRAELNKPGGPGVPSRSHGCALGSVMRAAAAKSRRWTEPSGLPFKRSERPVTHGEPRPLWRSLIFRGAAGNNGKQG